MRIEDIPTPSIEDLNNILQSGTHTLTELQWLAEAYIHAMPDSPKYRKIRKFYHYVGRSVQIRLSHEPYLFKAIIVWPYADYLMVKTMVDGESYLMEVKYGEINGVMYQTRDGDYEWYRFRGEHDGDKKERIKVGRKDHDEWDW